MAPAAKPRSLFLYGTLQALPLLAWALTGDPKRTEEITGLLQPAKITGYARFMVEGKDYPALIRHEAASVVEGLLLRPKTRSQRMKLDDFEGEAYKVTPVEVIVGDSGEVVDADAYVWGGEADAVSRDPWDLEVFVKERLEDWIELFGGMELVGDEEEDEEAERTK